MHNLRMDYEPSSTRQGNIGSAADLDISQGSHFTLGIAFGPLVTGLFQSLGVAFTLHRERFCDQPRSVCNYFLCLDRLLHDDGALSGFDPYSMVRSAAYYLITHCPATPQELWEENSRYSFCAPSR
jgi:hypothetical protein